jgi:hypothetical protein
VSGVEALGSQDHGTGAAGVEHGIAADAFGPEPVRISDAAVALARLNAVVRRITVM